MTTPPAPPVATTPAKKGLGCLGIGCIVVVIALILLGALFAGLGYFASSKINGLTSTTPGTVQSFDGGDGIYNSILQKTSAFDQAVQQNQPATLELSADEINTLIARDPSFAHNGIHLFVSMSGDHGNLQVSLPSNLIPFGLIKDRYFNVETDFTPVFDASDKNLSLNLRSLKMGGEIVPKEQLSAVQVQIDPLLNAQIQNSPDVKQVFDHAQSVEIRDGKLVIQTK